MKTFYKLFLAIFLAIGVSFIIAPVSMAQGPICDQDVPFMSLLPHPNSPDPQYEAEYDYLYRATKYDHLTCGSNKVHPVDPCDPWICTYYIAMWEQANDMVKLLPPTWNWDTTVCQDIRFEVVFPANYVAGTYYDSIVVKTTIIPHAFDDLTTCMLEPDSVWCFNANPPYWTHPSCWQDCLHERISYECVDSCEVPNSAICRVEYDKPLPVELESFVSKVVDNDVVLNWTTSIEENNSGFYVERLDNGVWKELGFVAGKGNSTTSTFYAYTDRDLNSGVYSYRLRQVDFNGNFEYLDLSGAVALGAPSEFTLAQNYPNPFNPTTTIVYGLPASGSVTLKIYDNSGKEVAVLVNEPKEAGFYTVTFRSNLPSGIYFYKLESGNFVAAKKMVIIK